MSFQSETFHYPSFHPHLVFHFELNYIADIAEAFVGNQSRRRIIENRVEKNRNPSHILPKNHYSNNQLVNNRIKKSKFWRAMIVYVCVSDTTARFC